MSKCLCKENYTCIRCRREHRTRVVPPVVKQEYPSTPQEATIPLREPALPGGALSDLERMRRQMRGLK